MKIFPSLRRFARSIKENGRTSRNDIVLALRLHLWSRVGHKPTLPPSPQNRHPMLRDAIRKAKYGTLYE